MSNYIGNGLTTDCLRVLYMLAAIKFLYTNVVLKKSFYLDARFIIIRHNILQSKINTDLINEGVLMDISSNIDWASLLYKKQNAITCIHDKKSAWDYESCTEKMMIPKGGSWIHNIIASDIDLQQYEKEVKK